MPSPQRSVSERIASCVVWGFLVGAAAYGLLLLVEGLIGAIR
ncbi:hypothetical protein [Pseudonocardia sp. MH-G8]|nr:hypothetical protein [Pseudonocardia sp. MH-G8]